MEKVNAQVINPVNIRAYQGFVNKYNSLLPDQRRDWLALDDAHTFPCDNPVLYVAGNGDYYVLEVIPVWASSRQSIEVQGTKDAEKYYGQKDLKHYDQDLYKQNLKIVVTHKSALWSNETFNYQNDNSDEFDYGIDDFLTRMKYIGLEKYFSHIKADDEIFNITDAVVALIKICKSSVVKELVVYDVCKNKKFKVSGISLFDLDEKPSEDNPFQVNYYSNKDDDIDYTVLTVNDALKSLARIPVKQRNLPLHVFDYSTTEDDYATSIELINGQVQIKFGEYAKLSSKKKQVSCPEKHYGLNFDRLVDLLTSTGKKNDDVYIDSYEELFNFNVLQDEVDTFNDNFEDLPILKCCQNKNNFDTYVYVDTDTLEYFSIAKINNIIKEFCGSATWSEYSLHYESSDEYPISEDEFIKHSKKLVNEFLIHSF